MKFGTYLCLIAMTCSLLPSCLSSTLAATAMAGGSMATNIPGVKALLGNAAPKATELAGCSFDYSGECRGADNISCPVSGSILFGQSNPSVMRLADGSTRSTFYSRKSDEKAIVTITTLAGVETYRLTFTDGKSGSYTYEKRCGTDFATGEGNFTIQ